jgi:hypothetical protein
MTSINSKERRLKFAQIMDILLRDVTAHAYTAGATYQQLYESRIVTTPLLFRVGIT